MNKNPNNKYLKIIVFIFIIGFTLSGFKSAEYKMEPLQTGEIVTGIYAVNDKFVNMFVIRDGESYLVVDAGSDANKLNLNFKAENRTGQGRSSFTHTYSSRSYRSHQFI